MSRLAIDEAVADLIVAIERVEGLARGNTLTPQESDRAAEAVRILESLGMRLIQRKKAVA